MSNKLIKTKTEKKKEKIAINPRIFIAILNIFILLCMPIVSYFMMEFMIRNPFEKIKPGIQVLNIVFWELLMFVLFFVYGSIRAAVRTEAIVAYLIGLLDYFVISFRGIPVQPWDILSIKVAMSVADGYEYKVKPQIIIFGLITIGICALAHFMEFKIDRRGRKKLLISLSCLLASILIMYGYIKHIQAESTVKRYGIYDKLFTPTTMTYRDGTMVAFIMECKYLKVDRPSGYLDRKAKELLDSYNTVDTLGSGKILVNSDADGVSDADTAFFANAKVTEKTPNIIVIMDEAFSDLSILQDYSVNMDEMPFVRSIMRGMDNTVSGYLDVSVLGGNTANTEFEYLTGNTMAWLPQGSVPYQQYIKESKESLASILKWQGYETVAIHPYKAGGWDRDKTYKFFGFDRFYAIDDFEDPEILRKYVSDLSDFNKVIEIYNSKPEGKPVFIFNVTMQNHSSYTDEFDNFEIDVNATGVDKLATNQYLSLIRRTDMSVEALINYLSMCEEPTMVVFFGDHQPTDSVVNPLYKLNGNSVTNLSEDELRDRYKVPFFIWANYDIDEATNMSLSPNFLGAKTLDIAGVKLSAYQKYLLELNKTYSSINVLGITDVSGNTKGVEAGRDDLIDYQRLQYYMLFK